MMTHSQWEWLIESEIQRRKLLAAVREARGSWRTEQHPELKDGSEAFVERLRAENEIRLKSASDSGTPAQ